MHNGWFGMSCTFRLASTVVWTMSLGCGDPARTHPYYGEPAAILTIDANAATTTPLDGYISSYFVGLEGRLGAPGYKGATTAYGAGEGQLLQGRTELPFYTILNSYEASPFIHLAGHFSPRSGPNVMWDESKVRRLIPRRHVVAFRDWDETALPFGPSGASLIIPRGVSIFERICKLDHQELVRVPLNTPIELIEVAAGPGSITPEQTEQEALRACNISLPPDEVGEKVATGGALDMAWTSDGKALLFLPHVPEAERSVFVSPPTPPMVRHSPAIHRLTMDTRITQVLAAGEFRGPLQVSPLGLAYVTVTTGTSPRGNTYELRLPAEGGGLLRGLGIPGGAWLSPDGSHLAALSTEIGAYRPAVRLFNAATGQSVASAEGMPVQWLADGQGFLLVSYDARALTKWSALRLDVTGALSTVGEGITRGPDGLPPPAPYRGGNDARLLGALFSPAATVIIRTAIDLALWSSPIQDPGLHQVVMSASAGRLQPDLARATNAGLFIWARKCLGLNETQCFHELHQVTAQGLDTVIARAQHPGPVALHPQGNSLAISTRDDIFLLPLNEPKLAARRQ